MNIYNLTPALHLPMYLLIYIPTHPSINLLTCLPTKPPTLRAPYLLDSLKCESEVKTVQEQGVGACSLARNILGVEGRVGALG
jgi:hypothetical protein